MASRDPGVEDKGLKKAGSTKKEYAKPAFQFEAVFETLALSCGKMQRQGGACNRHAKSS